MRILFLSAWFPYPPENGSKIRIFNLIRELSRRHEVHLLSFAASGEGEVLGDLERLCASVVAVPKIAFDPQGIRNVLGFLAPVPRSVVATYSRPMQEAIQAEVKRARPDLVLFSEISMAAYSGIFNKDVPRLLEDLEVTVIKEESTREKRPVVKFRRTLTSWKFGCYVRGLLNSLDACTTVSEREKQEILEIAPDVCPVEVIPNGVDLGALRPNGARPKAGTIIFSGALSYDANLDAMRYFLAEIYPIIRRRRSDVNMTVTGRHDGVSLSSLALDDSVSLPGYVPDIHSLVSGSWVCVVPLRVGAGTRLKILEAMALGTPVVSTTKGAEGLDVTNGSNILLADDPEAFADAVLRLMDDPSLRTSLAQNARALVETKYGWEEIGRNLDGLVERIVAGKAR